MEHDTLLCRRERGEVEVVAKFKEAAPLIEIIDRWQIKQLKVPSDFRTRLQNGRILTVSSSELFGQSNIDSGVCCVILLTATDPV